MGVCLVVDSEVDPALYLEGGSGGTSGVCSAGP